MRQEEEAASRTFPRKTEVVPTPAGQGDASSVPAIQGSSATVQVPLSMTSTFTAKSLFYLQIYFNVGHFLGYIEAESVFFSIYLLYYDL